MEGGRVLCIQRAESCRRMTQMKANREDINDDVVDSGVERRACVDGGEDKMQEIC